MKFINIFVILSTILFIAEAIAHDFFGVELILHKCPVLVMIPIVTAGFAGTILLGFYMVYSIMKVVFNEGDD
jgi:hypothetical protein